jgi:hypothetical protein
MIRLLLIGLLLSIDELKSATISSAYLALTKKMDLRDQLRLKIKTGPGKDDFIDRDRLYYAAEFLTSRLAYGASVAAEIGEDEVARRRDAVLRASNALLNYTSEATDVDDSRLAIDATAIWAWARGPYYPRPTVAEIEAQEDPLIRAKLQKLRDGSGATDDLDGAHVTTDEERIVGLDLDAAWSGATAKNGGTKRFYGYFAHLIAAIPDARRRDDPVATAPIVRRVELLRSTEDVVDVSFRMIDSLPTFPKELLGDRHYSYKEFARWAQPLLRRGVRQVLDLRSDDHKAITLPEGIFVDGFGHCPAMPRELLGMHRPGIFARRAEHEQSQREKAERERYAHGVLNLMDSEGRTKLRCPARQFKVGCPLYPPSMAVAAENALPIVNADLLELESGEEPPRCCTQDSFRITLPEPVAKLNQTNYWGTEAWYHAFSGRTYVEGVFGNIKNPRTENLSRGSIQKTGIVWSQLIVTLMCTTYNVRIIRERHARIGNEWTGHPLLTAGADTVTHVSLSAADERRLSEAYFNGVDIEDLEVQLPTSCDVTADPRHPIERKAQRVASVLPFWLHSNSRGVLASTGSR